MEYIPPVISERIRGSWVSFLSGDLLNSIGIICFETEFRAFSPHFYIRVENIRNNPQKDKQIYVEKCLDYS